MGVFQPVTFTWSRGDGAEVKFVIPPDRVMRAIAVVEGHMTMRDIMDQMITGNVKMTQVAMAYTALLRYAASIDPKNHADFRVEVEEVYEELFGDGSNDNPDFLGSRQTALGTLLSMMIPPNKLAKKMMTDRSKGGDQDAGKDQPTESKTSG